MGKPLEYKIFCPKRRFELNGFGFIIPEINEKFVKKENQEKELNKLIDENLIENKILKKGKTYLVERTKQILNSFYREAYMHFQ